MKWFSSSSKDNEVVAYLTSSQTELLAFIHSLLPGNPSVKDVLQRVNMVIWKKRSHYKQGTNFRAWAFSIARWEVRSFLKECKRASWLVLDDELVEKIADSIEAKPAARGTDEMRAHLDECLGKLKPAERELIDQRYFSSMSLKDYAEAQGRPVTSLKTTLYRIRASLKSCIEGRIAVEQATNPSS